MTRDVRDLDPLEPLDPDLRRLLEAEAYRSPVRLLGADLAARAAVADREHAPWRRWAGPFAAAAAAVAIAIGLSTLSVGPWSPGVPAAPSAPACDESPATIQGPWWSEVGGPNAFFNIEPGTRHATNPDETWLLHVRFDPDAPESMLDLMATDLATGGRIEGMLNSRVDPANIYRLDDPAPALPGGWYLFQIRIPDAGCWRLEATVDGAPAGSAIVNVAPALRRSDPTGGPEPTLGPDLPDRIGCSGDVETAPVSGPTAPATNCHAAIELLQRAHPDLVANAWAVTVQPMCPRGSDCDLGDPYTIVVVLLAPPSSSAGWLAYLVVGETAPERLGRIALDLPDHALDAITAQGVQAHRSYRLVCGPLDPEPCAVRAFVVIRAGEGTSPAPVESVTFRDEKGSYTMRFTDGESVTGIFD